MVFEMFSFASDDTFNYDDNMPCADTVEFSDDRRGVIIKSGLPLGEEVLELFENDTLTHRHGWLVHVSDQENEYIFQLDRKVNGGEIFHTIEGATNKHIYILQGVTGQLLRVKYKYHYVGIDECAKANNKYFGDVFGDVLFGQITADTFNAGAKIGDFRIANNKINKNEGTQGRWDIRSAPVEHNTNPDTYRQDQLNPFWVMFINNTPNIPEIYSMDFIQWAGGGPAMLRTQTAIKEIKIAVCEWL